MKTTVLTVDPATPETKAIALAAETLRRGDLVAFPTETVYGLGANALDPAAVVKIFEAKGRPSNNPIIVHVADSTAARDLAAEWPAAAIALAERFWPGPLTLILPKNESIPDIVTAGGPTVGIRVPAHPVALAILRAARIPIAAPSANRSTEVSPTSAAHVLKGLEGRVAIVVDSGATTGGIESTVLDLSTRPPRLLRHGLISAEQIVAVIGPIDGGPVAHSPGDPLPSPGQMRRHYAPRAKVDLVVGDNHGRVKELQAQNVRVGWMPLGRHDDPHSPDIVLESMPGEPDAYAAHLYSTLHKMDDAGVVRIVIELPPDTPEWQAIRDRLSRAASEI